MNCTIHRFKFPAVLFAAIFTLVFVGCSGGQKIIDAEFQVKRIADTLDKKTTGAGVYIRSQDGDIKETDPWNTPINVSYSQGGVAEIVHVRSAGPDRRLDTADDVVAERMSANFKGIGEGAQQNVEETAQRAAKGVVKGAVQGVREAVKESLPSRMKIDKGAVPLTDGPSPADDPGRAK